MSLALPALPPRSDGYSAGCDVLPVDGYYCHTANDECTDDDECTTGFCNWVPMTGKWQCVPKPICTG